MGAPDVSVVISTHNRAEQLPVAVNACLEQAGSTNYELIVVDNDSTDGTRAWVEGRIADGASRLRYVFEPRRGLPYGRNAGIAHARAAIIAFTDDDVRVASDWVSAIAEAFARYPEVDMIGGKVLPEWPPVVPNWFSRLQWAPLALQDKGDAPLAIGADNAAPCLIGASFAFRRRVFEQIGMFDVAYTRAQDREIQMRLWRAGGRGLYVPSVVAWTPVPSERLTKKYFRFWHTRSGGYASRMRLLDQLDRDGRLFDPAARPGRTWLGCPGHIYRSILEHLAGWAFATARRDEALAFYHENRARFCVAYVKARAAEPRQAPAPAAVIAPHRPSGELS